MGPSLTLFGVQHMFIAAWCSGAVSGCTRQWFEHTLCYHLTTFHIPTWQSTVKHTTTTANKTHLCFAHLQTQALCRKCYYLQAETDKEREPLQTYKESPTGQVCLPKIWILIWTVAKYCLSITGIPWAQGSISRQWGPVHLRVWDDCCCTIFIQGGISIGLHGSLSLSTLSGHHPTCHLFLRCLTTPTLNINECSLRKFLLDKAACKAISVNSFSALSTAHLSDLDLCWLWILHLHKRYNILFCLITTTSQL